MRRQPAALRGRRCRRHRYGSRFCRGQSNCRHRAPAYRGLRCGRRNADSACAGEGSREERRWECDRCRSRRRRGSRHHRSGATAPATVVNLSVSVRRLPAKAWRAWSAEGSEKSVPEPRGIGSMSMSLSGIFMSSQFVFFDTVTECGARPASRSRQRLHATIPLRPIAPVSRQKQDQPFGAIAPARLHPIVTVQISARLMTSGQNILKQRNAETVGQSFRKG